MLSILCYSNIHMLYFWQQKPDIKHPRSQALLAACVAISPGTDRTRTPQIVVFTGSKRPTAVD